MIYLVKDFGWTHYVDEPVPPHTSHVMLIETGPSWQEIDALCAAVWKRRKHGAELLATAPSMTYGKLKAAKLGQLILPGDFFRRAAKADKPGAGESSNKNARRYQPLDEWDTYVNMDGDYFWVPTEDDDSPQNYRGCFEEWYEPEERAFAALTPELAGQLWADWHLHPPKQKTVMAHFGAELHARKG